MVLQQSLSQLQSQQLALTQANRQSIEILGLSNQVLEEYIQKELLENPFLEETENTVPLPLANKLTTSSPSLSEFKSNQVAAEKSEKLHNFLQNAVSSHESLGDYLLWQLNMELLDSEEQKIGELLVSDIDERGYLCHSLADLLGPAHSLKKAERILELIQSLDPVGCGASNLAQTLLIQAQHRYPNDSNSQKILKHYFSDFEKLNLGAIVHKSGLGLEQVRECLRFIRNLEPYPGYLYAPPKTEYIIPDIIVVQNQQPKSKDTSSIDAKEVLFNLEVFLSDEWLPKLQLGQTQEDFLRQSHKNNKDYPYMKEKFQAAQSLLYNIQRRKQTLLQVARAIVNYQKDFFILGPSHLKPLILHNIAQELKLHESTISRAVANKYMQTKWGYFTLKYFFAKGIKSALSQEGTTTNRNIQQRLLVLVQNESAEKPLSDQELVVLLGKEGTTIARRTVAKYRKQLGIASVRMRRKLKQMV